MATYAGTVDGWRARASKVWYPSSGFAAIGSATGAAANNISCPTTTATGSTSSGNKYGVILRVKTPSYAGISSITKLSISFKIYDRNTTKGTVYGSLRTTYTDSGSGDTVAFFRTKAIGSEASTANLGTTATTVTWDFSGSFSTNTYYYLFLYTKSTNDIYGVDNNMSPSCTATYTPITYTISYNANGHGTAPSSQSKEYGSTLTLQPFISNVSGTGYKVTYDANGGSSTPTAQTASLTYSQTYWNTNSSGTGTNYGSQGSYTTNASATMYAQWSETRGSITLAAAISRSNGTSSYSVTYDANGGSSTPQAQTLTRSTPYTFNGWTIGGTVYKAGVSYKPTAATTATASWLEGTVTGSITLAAAISRSNGTESGFTVTFNAMGGNCSTRSTTAQNTIKYTFDKWVGSDGKTYSAGASYSTSTNVTLTASWNGATTKGSINLPTPTKSGYTFAGWATSDTATEGITGTYTPTDNITLYAVWVQSNSVVYYNDNGTTRACSIYYNNNGTAVLCDLYYNNNGSAIKI